LLVEDVYPTEGVCSRSGRLRDNSGSGYAFLSRLVIRLSTETDQRAPWVLPGRSTAALEKP
jgi:hypothetical protein